MENTTLSFGYWVRRQRRARDLTQQALAGCVGCSVATIKKIEGDERRPSVQMAERLALCLHIADDQRARFMQVAQREQAPDVLPVATTPVAQLATLPVVLPERPATTFVGRAGELQIIGQRLLHENCRLLTVAGLGGVGKTRLALEAATALAPHYGDGVCWVWLADVDDVAGVAPAVLGRLGLPLVDHEDATNQLVQALRQRHLLLILDNMEQLAHSAHIGALLNQLLAEAPQLALLITSRERLGLQAEWLLVLEGLPPGEAADALFIDRARRVGQEVPPEAATAIHTISRLVEGLPLALELAASWTPLLSPAHIAAQLEGEQLLLGTRLRDLPTRHQSVDALFDRSLALLSEAEQVSWMRLALFRGGCDSRAAAAVAAADLRTLGALLDKSLLRAYGNDRFDLHALARRYALRRLEATGALAPAREQHANYYFALLHQFNNWADLSEVPTWTERIQTDYANIRAAWHWALETARWDALWPVVHPLLFFWMRYGSLSDGRDLLAAVVQQAPPDGSPGYVQTLLAYGVLLARTGRIAEALQRAPQTYRLALHTEDPVTIARAEMDAGMFSADPVAREAHFQAAIATTRQIGHRLLLAESLLLYGDSLRERGSLQAARGCYSECLAHAQAIHDDGMILHMSGNLGRLALFEGALSEAAARFAECVALARRQNIPLVLADWLLRLGVVQVYEHQHDAAHATLTECVALAEALNHWRCVPNARVWLAVAALERGDDAANHSLQQSLAEYDCRLDSHPSAHPSPAELQEALIAVAHTQAALGRGEQAALALGCAEALAAQAPADPFLGALAKQVQGQLARQMQAVALDAALARGREALPRACFGV